MLLLENNTVNAKTIAVLFKKGKKGEKNDSFIVGGSVIMSLFKNCNNYIQIAK